MNQRTRLTLLVLCAVAGVMLLIGSADAQTNLHNGSAAYAGLLELIQSSANSWAARLRGYAIHVFWALAVIQLVWTLFPLVMRQADFGELVGELLRFILVTGFFYALLMYSVDWGNAVVNSFRQAGAAAAGVSTGLKPGDIFGIGVSLAQLIGDAETWNPLAAMAIALSGVLVLLCFVFIAAFIGVTLIESYIVINASVLFMGFGGGQWTREYAIAMARYAVAVGAKLFVLTLIVGLVMQSVRDWQTAYNHDMASMWTMVGMAFVCAYLTKTLAELVHSLIMGTSLGGGHALGSMATAAAAGAAAAAATLASGGLGAAAAAASGTGGAAGSTGLAGAINSSLAGAASDVGRAGSVGASGMDSAAASLMPRVGGPPGRLVGGGSGGAATQPQGTQGTQPTPEAAFRRGVAATALRGTGVLAAMSVPGMEGAAGLSIGPPMPQAPAPSGTDAPSDFTPSDNVIAPAAKGAVPPAPERPAPPPEGGTKA